MMQPCSQFGTIGRGVQKSLVGRGKAQLQSGWARIIGSRFFSMWMLTSAEIERLDPRSSSLNIHKSNIQDRKDFALYSLGLLQLFDCVL